MSSVILAKKQLPANVSYTQEMQDRFGYNEPVGFVSGEVYSNTAGTLYLEESDNAGTSWTQTATITVNAGATTPLPWTKLTKRWFRFRYVNGAAAQGSFILVQQVEGLDFVLRDSDGNLRTAANDIVVRDSTTANNKLAVNADGSVNTVAQLTGSTVEKASAQDNQPATTEVTYNRAEGASQIEVYCESGYIRVRTDGQPCTSTTGEPIAAGFGAAWAAETVSVFYVQESIVTVVSR